MRFAEVFQLAGVAPDLLSGDAELTTWVMDSRLAVSGCCFVCMPSENTDSHGYLEAARAAGAVAAVVHSEEGFAQARSLGMASALIVPGNVDAQGEETTEQRIRRTTGRFSDALWRLAKVAFGNPSSKLRVFGVTGTNGKTTTAWLIRDMLTLMSVPCAYIGTLGFGLPKLPLPNEVGEGVGGWGSSGFQIADFRSKIGGAEARSGDSGGEGLWDEELRPLANTTPFAIELNAMLAEAVSRGCQAVAMEVSSHALAERRCDGIEFDVAVFTNLSQDHLDYHGTMEAYLAAKRRLFSDLPLSASGSSRGEGLPRFHRGAGGWGSPGFLISDFRCEPKAVVNVGDPAGADLARELGDGTLRFREVHGFNQLDPEDTSVDIVGYGSTVGLSRITLSLESQREGDPGFAANLGGAYNVQNLLAATCAVHALGFTLEDITQFITTLLRPVPGRFEPVPNDAGIGIIVDYAHTPDALDKLLETARPLTKGRIITVFGCGGDRDKSKRPLMAQAAARGSDIVVVTSDNPRTEDPDAIIAEILAEFPTPQPPDEIGAGPLLEDDGPSRRGGVRIEPDRPAAVALAIKLAEPGDCVIIAGKGHENYQIIGRDKHPMDDRDLAREGLKQR